MIPSHPQTCIDYGFSRCNTEKELSNLISLYIGLIKLLEVDPMDLHRARRKGRLASEIMFHYEKLPIPNRGDYYPWFLKNLHIVQPTIFTPRPKTTADSTPDFGNLSVDDLVRLIADPDGEVIPSVGADYGFSNCRGPVEQAQLKAIYQQYFRRPNAQKYALHEACIQGKTFEHVSSVVPINKEQQTLFKRLMSNPYPLLDL
jgi:hypothetical protein